MAGEVLQMPDRDEPEIVKYRGYEIELSRNPVTKLYQFRFEYKRPTPFSGTSVTREDAINKAKRLIGTLTRQRP